MTPRARRAAIIAGVVMIAAAVLLGRAILRGRSAAEAEGAGGTGAAGPAGTATRPGGPPGDLPSAPAAAGPATLPRLSGPDLERLSEPLRALVLRRQETLASALNRRPPPGAEELADAWGGAGMAYFAARLGSAAESCLAEAERLAPGDARWPHLLGHLYRTLGDAGRAAEAWRRALRISPGATPTLLWLARLEMERNRPEEAEPLLRRALESSPGSAAALYGLGRIALQAGRHEEAVEQLKAALERDPRATLVHYPLALAYRGLGRMREAESHMNRRGTVEPLPEDPLLASVERLAPDPLAFMAAGRQAFDEGRWGEAAAEFRKAAEAFPDNPAVRWNLGAALAKVGDVRGALEQFQETLRLSPGNASALDSIGLVLSDQGRHAEALDHYARAVGSDPGYRPARLNLADGLSRERRWEEALPHYRKAVELDPADRRGRMGLSLALIRTGRFAEAKRLLEESMRALPEESVFAHYLARLLATSPDDSVRDGQRALTIASELIARESNAALAQTLAMALAEAGRYEEAVDVQRRVIAAVREGGRPDLLPLMEENLALYLGGRPCRSFWLE